MSGLAARRAGNLVEVAGRSFEVKIASNADEYEQAFLLLALKYQAKGYEDAGAKLFRFTPFHVLPETITIVGMEGSRVASTISMVPDTRLLGLPLESIYPDEVAGFRRAGRRLAEIICLADDGLAPREFREVFEAMIQLFQQYQLRIGGDTWLLTVNPRHGAFYRRLMGARPFGDRRSYPSVANAPAEAYLIDLPTMRADAPRMFDRVFGSPLPDSVLIPLPRAEDHVAFFSEHSTAADRRTIRSIGEAVENLGSPPRWWETADDVAHLGRRLPPARPSAA